VISTYEEELRDADLLELNKNQHYDKDQEEESEKLNTKVITVKKLSKAFQLIERGLQIIYNEDSHYERF